MIELDELHPVVLHHVPDVGATHGQKGERIPGRGIDDLAQLLVREGSVAGKADGLHMRLLALGDAKLEVHIVVRCGVVEGLDLDEEETFLMVEELNDVDALLDEVAVQYCSLAQRNVAQELILRNLAVAGKGNGPKGGLLHHYICDRKASLELRYVDLNVFEVPKAVDFFQIFADGVDTK